MFARSSILVKSIIFISSCLQMSVGAPNYDVSNDNSGPELPATNIPQIITEPMVLAVKDGDTVKLDCDVIDLDPFVLIWKKGEKIILFAGTLQVHKDSRISLDGSSLKIRGVQMTDVGQYICQISTNPPLEIVHNVTILVTPQITTTPHSGLVVVQKGFSVDLICNTQGNPTPKVSWVKQAGSLETARIEDDGRKLTIENATPEDTGLYECMATNGVGDQMKQVFQVKVLYEPEIQVNNTLVHTAKGSDAQLICNVFAAPHADVSWLRGKTNQKIKNSSKYIIKRNGTEAMLQITNIGIDDFDVYTCVANSTLGVKNKTIEVTGVPSKIVIKSEKRSDSQTEYELMWETLSHSPILNFKLRVRTAIKDDGGDPGSWNHTEISPAAPEGYKYTQTYKLTDLEPDTFYEVEIVSENEYGTSSPTEFSFSTLGSRNSKSPRLSTDSTSSTSFSFHLITVCLLMTIANYCH